MSAKDANTELLRALAGAAVAALPPGFRLAKSEQRRRENETRERAAARIGKLFDAVIEAMATGAPLERPQLKTIAVILAGMLRESEETKRGAGRRRLDHRLIVMDVLLRKRKEPGAALKRLRASVASDWGTTDANVKKLVAENQRLACALLENIGEQDAAKAVLAARKLRQRYRN